MLLRFDDQIGMIPLDNLEHALGVLFLHTRWRGIDTPVGGSIVWVEPLDCRSDRLGVSDERDPVAVLKDVVGVGDAGVFATSEAGNNSRTNTISLFSVRKME